MELLVRECQKREQDHSGLKKVEEQFKAQLLINLELEHCLAKMHLKQSPNKEAGQAIEKQLKLELEQLQSEFSEARRIGQAQMDALQHINQQQQREIDRLNKLMGGGPTLTSLE